MPVCTEAVSNPSASCGVAREVVLEGPVDSSVILSFFLSFSFVIRIQLIHKRSHMRAWDIELVKNYKYTNNFCNRSTTVNENTK